MSSPWIVCPIQACRSRDTDAQAAQASLARSVGLVRSEYLESPGLQLTRSEARRFWNFDTVTCDLVLDLLTVTKFLRETTAGAFVRTECGSHSSRTQRSQRTRSFLLS
jgi:hypothetical protein